MSGSLSGEGHELYRRDIEQCPAAIRVNISRVDITILDENCGVVCAELDLASEIAGLPFNITFSHGWTAVESYFCSAERQMAAHACAYFKALAIAGRG